MLAAQLGRFLFFNGQPELAVERVESALAMAESLLLPEVLAQALTTKGVLLTSRGRREEGIALLRFAIDSALEHDKPSTALRASFNLADCLGQVNRFAEGAETVRAGLDQARRVGNRYWEISFLGQLYPFLTLGEWDEALAMCAQLPIDDWASFRQAFATMPLVEATVLGNRGEVDRVHGMLARFEDMSSSGDEQERSAYRSGLARFQLTSGNLREALAAAEDAFASHVHFGFGAEQIKEAFATAGEAALQLGERAKAAELVAVVDALPPGATNLFMQAHSSRFRAHLVAESDPAESDRLFRRSAAHFRELSAPVALAVVQTEHAEMLLAGGGGVDELVAEAGTVFERLGAQPWLERLAGLRTGVTA
jgi:tetratricopeptide (TPR) repeat protein